MQYILWLRLRPKVQIQIYQGIIKPCCAPMQTSLLKLKALKYKLLKQRTHGNIAFNVPLGTWTFHIKRYLNNQIKKYKARFCVRGDKQIQGVDVFNTYVPVVEWSTVHMMLVVVACLKWESVQVDFDAALSTQCCHQKNKFTWKCQETFLPKHHHQRETMSWSWVRLCTEWSRAPSIGSQGWRMLYSILTWDLSNHRLINAFSTRRMW